MRQDLERRETNKSQIKNKIQAIDYPTYNYDVCFQYSCSGSNKFNCILIIRPQTQHSGHIQWHELHLLLELPVATDVCTGG